LRMQNTTRLLLDFWSCISEQTVVGGGFACSDARRRVLRPFVLDIEPLAPFVARVVAEKCVDTLHTRVARQVKTRFRLRTGARRGAPMAPIWETCCPRSLSPYSRDELQIAGSVNR